MIEPVNINNRKRKKTKTETEASKRRKKGTGLDLGPELGGSGWPSTEPWTKIWSKPLTELVELNSAFSTILPYVLSEKLKIEFQDVDGAALNASAIVAENYLMESTPQVDLRVVQPIKMHF